MLISPLVMGAGMYFVTGRLYSLMFMVFSPIMMIANQIQGRSNQKKDFRDRLRKYEEQRDQTEDAAFKALTGVVAEVLSGRARLTGRVQIPQPEALELHERVAGAIAAGDATTAESSMRDLVAEVRSALLERGLRGFLEA